MASIKILLFKGKKLNNGEHPILLRITKNRKSKYISLGYNCTPKQWNDRNQSFKRNYPNYEKRNQVLAEVKSKAYKVLDAFRSNENEFSLNQFVEKFKGISKGTNTTVWTAFQDKIILLKTSNKTGNTKVYAETSKSFFSFTKDKSLKFKDITLTVLEGYEAYLRNRGGTGGGISVKMRTLRALYNDAIKKGYAKQDHYPFSKYNISKLKGSGIKKAFTRDEVKLIENFPLDQYPHLTDARHYFIFSYFTRGMNFIDMMMLRWADVNNDRITYIRAKTAKPYVIKILPPVREILDYYKGFNHGTSYIFPILLHNGLTAAQRANRKTKVLKQYNKYLKEIAGILGINKPLSSYVARHSFATNMKHAGIPISIISESLGHANLDVTEVYLKAFENDIIDEATEVLL